MPICFAALMCHSPVVIPKIGLSQSEECKKTTAAMRKVAKDLVNLNPDQIIVISPHAPKIPDKFGILNQRISGNFGTFGKHDVKINLPWDKIIVEELENDPSHAFEVLPKVDLDHGSMVPLWFLQEAGWEGKTTIISLPVLGAFDYIEKATNALHEILRRDPQNFAIIASGDLSHCLTEKSPGGFHKDAKKFDEDVVQALKDCDLERITEFDDQLRLDVGEDAIEPLCFAIFTCQQPESKVKFLSYEAPFGVGYGISILHHISPDDIDH